VAELRGGVIERLRVTPVARVALLLGRALRDVVVLLVQCAVIVLVSLPFGLTINTAGLLVSLALLALVWLMTAALSYAVALWLKSEDALAPILSTVTVPLLLLSGVLLPLSLAPAWLRAVALANPLAYAVDATRALFNDHLMDASVPKGVLIMAVLMVASVATAARAYGRAVA
jgi:ABC-2 type transport system permease protein